MARDRTIVNYDPSENASRFSEMPRRYGLPGWCGRRDSNPGRRRGRPSLPVQARPREAPYAPFNYQIDWRECREDFLEYLKTKEYSPRYVRDILSYLDRYITVVREPMDVISTFSSMKAGKKNLNRALRALLNFHEATGIDKAWLDALRKAIPRDKYGIDLRIPSEDEILDFLRRLEKAPKKYVALYYLLLDSGLRLSEAARLINEFRGAERISGFCRCGLGWFKESKRAYFAHFTEPTFRLIEGTEEPINDRAASHYFHKYGYVAPKYLRKFAFDKMIELGVPESVADFVEVRVPKRIGAKHYLALARQACKFYGKYVEYLNSLKRKLS